MNILKFKNKLFYYLNKSVLFNKKNSVATVLIKLNKIPICYSSQSENKQNHFNFINILPLIPIFIYGSHRKVECETKSTNLSK